MVLLSDDVFTIAPDKLKDAKVVWTVVGGKAVYRDSGMN
jgi:predicted amidohydrolase YtcJ